MKQVKGKVEEEKPQIIPAHKSTSQVRIKNDNSLKELKHAQKKIKRIHDQTKTYHAQIKEFFNNNVITPKEIKYLYNNTTSPPLFKPLIETQKLEQPIRPVINSIPSPSYKIAKYINQAPKRNLTRDNVSSSKNTKDYLNKLHYCKPTKRDILILLFIDYMYDNIPKG